MRKTLWILATCVLLSMPAAAQTTPDSLTAAEQRVQEIIKKDGIHVVHFWAPWCPNSITELSTAWKEIVERNPEVSFTFVTIWNNNKSGLASIQKYGLPERVVELTQPDFGPSKDKSQRRKKFLGLPVTWIPSTWIFHKNGELAFAMNFGEMDAATVQKLIDATRASWSH